MKISHCKLKKSTQKKLLEFFIAEVTARTAANLLEIQPNTAAMFYHKIRLVIKRKIQPDSWGYTDTYRSYNALDVSEFHHEKINHSELFAVKQNHINGIENFWSQAKRVLRKYNGINRKNFPLFLKECEFRFNFGTPSQQLKTLRKWCGV